MSECLTGTGGSITDGSCSACIGDWEITRYTGVSGLSCWKGRALLKRESRLMGSAEAVFEKEGKVYRGTVIVNHTPRNWNRCAVEDRAIVSFRGSGALMED